MTGQLDPRNNPVITATLLAPAIAWLAARYGLDVTDTQATQVAAAILVAGSLLARGAVRTRRTLPDPDAEAGQPSPGLTRYERPPRPDGLPHRPAPSGRPDRPPE